MLDVGSDHEPWDFRDALVATLGRVGRDHPAATWFAARVTGDEAVVLATSSGDREHLLEPGTYRTAALVESASVTAPLVDHRRGTFGVLGGIVESTLPDHHSAAAAAEFHAAMLSSILAAELRAEEEHRRAERAELVAMIDPLTGAANRRGWEALLGAEEARCERYGDPAAVLVVKLSALALVNETYGLAAGDEVLRLATQVLESCLREPDAVARLSGNEFGVLVVDCDRDQSERLAVRLEATLLDNGISATLGAAVRGSDHPSLLDTWRAAEAAMFEARRERAQLRRHAGLRHDRLLVAQAPWSVEPPDVAPPLRAVSPETLARAIEGDQFRLHLQEVVHLADGSPSGAEALLRWQHPTRGLIGPGEFLGVAEQAGTIEPIGRWVVGEACAAAKRFSEAGFSDDFFVAANVSVHQLEDPTFAPAVIEALIEADLEPTRLHIEVTETLPLGDSLAMNSNLATLRSCGVKIALDDFGTRYATLETLMRCPLDVVKIDRIFVSRITIDSVARALVSSVVGLCAEIGLDVVAEGIETPEQAEALVEVGCPSGQGYFFGRPLPVEQFLARPVVVS